MAFLRCDKCQRSLPGAVVNTPAPVGCPVCGAQLLVEVFPAFLRPVTRGRASEALVSQEDAGCFYHPHKKAVVPCEDCGRFLCALCDLEIDARHVCPACVETARQGGKGLRTGGQRTLHDQAALALAVAGAATFGLSYFVPILFGWVSILTAPVAAFLVVRYWREPANSPVPRSRARLIVAGLLAFLQIAAWLFLLYPSLHQHS